MYFSYVYAELRRLFFESFVWKLGLTCNIAAATWFWNCSHHKRIWKKKTKFSYFSYNPTNKKEKSRQKDQKKNEIPLLEISRDSEQVRKLHLTMTKKKSVYEYQFAAADSFFNFHSLVYITFLANSTLSRETNL